MADSQYIIEIAANMPDGAATIAELDELTASLTGAGKKSDDFQAAIKRLTTDLDAAKVASAEAAAALALGNDQYKILERDAIRAAKAVEKAQAAGRFDARAAKAAHEASVALEEYSGTLKGLESDAAAATARQDKLAKSLGNVGKLGAHVDARNAALSQRYEKLGAVVSRLPGPLGAVGGRLLGAGKAAHEASLALGGVNLAALAVAAGSVLALAAVAALTVAVVAGAIAFTQYAASKADAGRSADLAREAFAALSAETAAGVAAFDAIAEATGLADKELVALTKQLRAANVSASDMPEALRAAALAERALGTGGASDFIKRLDDGTASVRDLADEVEDKFGGVVAKQMRGLDALAKRFSKSWDKLFAGVNIDPILDGLAVLVGMFDKGHPLAQAFGAAVEGAINPIADMALSAAYAVEAFALGFAIQLTKMYIAVKPALKWLGEFFGFDGSGLNDTFAKAGEIAAVLATVVGVVMVGAMAALALVLAPVVAFFGLLGLAISETVSFAWALVTGLVEVGTAIVTWAQTIGVDLMMGLVGGITSTVTAVVDAVKNAVGLAITAAKDVLGIASPSKVFAEIGDNTVAGFTGAVDDGSEDAQGSMAALVAPESAASAGPSAGAAAAAGGKGGGGKSIDMAGATFIFNGVANAESARDMFAEMFTKILEGDADSLAGAEVPA